MISSSSESGHRIVETLCRAGFKLVGPDDLLSRGGAGRQVALVDMRSHAGEALRRVRRRQPELAIVALIDGDDMDAHTAALREGAATAVPVHASGEALVAATFAAAEGRTLLPNEVAVRLSRAIVDHGDGPDLGDVERRLLELLAHGSSIRAVADALGYSERQMHRKANDLYRRLGASGRAEALVRAANQGLVEL